MLSSFLVQHTLDQVGMATDLSHSQQKGQQMMSFHTSIIWTWRESSLVKRSQAEPSQVESSRQVKLLVTSYTQTAYLRGLNQSWNVSLRFIDLYIFCFGKKEFYFVLDYWFLIIFLKWLQGLFHLSYVRDPTLLSDRHIIVSDVSTLLVMSGDRSLSCWLLVDLGTLMVNMR